MRGGLSTLVWMLGGWLASRRPPTVSPADLRRHDYRTQTRGMGVRMTEWLRDRLRPSWLRLRGDDSPDPHP